MVSGNRVLFLINPRSGGRQTAEVIRKLKQYSICSEDFVQVEELSPENLPLQIAQARLADIVVIGGGDGTVSSILPALRGSDAKIGILPLGTANDLARELGLMGLGLGDNPRDTIEFYRTTTSRKISIFDLEYGDDFSSSKGFVNYVSFGFDAKVVTDFAQLRNTGLWRVFRGVWVNRVGYGAICLKHFYHRPNFRSTCIVSGTGTIFRPAEAKSVIFSNIRSIMGLGLSNLHSSPYDENIECIEVRSILNYLTMLFRFRLSLLKPNFLGSSNLWELEGISDDMQVQIDGEPMPNIKSKKFRIIQKGQVLMIVRSDSQSGTTSIR